jgi:iron complex transport system substrate-binding protein
MKITKKWFTMVTMSLTLLLSACGQSAAPQQGTGSQPSTTSGTPTQAEKPADEDLKIASLSIHLTNNLLALGITPAGSVIGGAEKDFLPHVKDRLTETKKLGVASDPDMEAILELKPDVIYVDKQYGGSDLAKYEKISPVEVFDLDEGTWRDHLKKTGELVNREQQAEEFLKAYDEQVVQVQELMKKQIGDGTVMAIRVSAKELRVMGMKRPMGPLLYGDLALKPAKGVEKIDKAYAVISQEILPDFDADAIFMIVNKDEEAKKIAEQLQDNPIWQGLKAVKNNQVYVLNGNPWLDYSSLGHKIALDNAVELMTKK